MQSHATWMGHPVYEMLIVLSLGLLGTAVVFDLIDLATATGAFAIAAYWLISAGIVAGLLAAPFAVIDWLHVRAGKRPRRIGAQHVVGNAVVLLLFIGSWALRDDQGLVPVAALALSLSGAIVSIVSGWLGSERVSRPAGAARDDANADASSSMAFEDSTISGAVREPPLRAG